MTRTSRGGLLAALVALLALSTLAPWVGSGTAGAQQRRVVVVGDSIILGAQGPITSSFAGQGWGVTFDAAVSRSTSAGLQAIESHRAELTDSLVVSLGANDAGNPSTFRQRVQAIMDATAGVPHVYWVTIREVRDYYGPANQVVREVAAGRPNVTVVDWHAATAGATDLTSSDGLHLNGAGAARMAQVVTDAVVAGTLPGAAAPPPAPPPDPPATTVAPPPPESTVPVTEPPTTVPDTTVAPTTASAPSSTPAPEDRTADRTPARTLERAAAEGADSSILDADALWTVGGGFVAVIVLLAACGVGLAAWALLRSRQRPTTEQSAAHPAVRARQRAERIAAASSAGPAPSEELTVDTQQS